MLEQKGLCNPAVYMLVGRIVCHHSPFHHKFCLNMSVLHLSRVQVLWRGVQQAHCEHLEQMSKWQVPGTFAVPPSWELYLKEHTAGSRKSELQLNKWQLNTRRIALYQIEPGLLLNSPNISNSTYWYFYAREIRIVLMMRLNFAQGLTVCITMFKTQ